MMPFGTFKENSKKLQLMEKYTLFNADCLEAMKQMPDNSIDAIVTDPPYGLNFMGKDFDNPKMMGQSAFLHGGLKNYPQGVKRTGYADCDMVKFQNYMTPIFAEALRVSKPGAHLLAFGGSRTFHRMACAIEDAGWEIRDCIMWVYGCLSEDSQILTKQGWKGIGEIHEGDEVIAYSKEGRNFKVERVERTYLYDYDDTAYRIQSDSTDQLVSKNHRVLIERDGVEVFEFAENLAHESQICVPVLEDMQDVQDCVPNIQWRAVTTMARIAPIRYKGRMWCVSVPSGAIVARRNGKVFVTGNSGFPKSMDVSKAIDKKLGVERTEVVGTRHRNVKPYDDGNGWNANNTNGDFQYTAPASEEAKKWNGWGSCLKPAFEPIVMARKPVEGSIVDNVLKHGVGGINIDGCRVATEDMPKSCVGNGFRSVNDKNAEQGYRSKSYSAEKATYEPSNLGRFPANLIHDGSEEVLACFPDNVKGGTWQRTEKARHFQNNGEKTNCVCGGHDKSIGSAARFFYCAKASRKERGEGNTHPTVKPLALMEYLVKLIAPQGAVVLDPFMGSGTTGVATRKLGRNFVGIEMDASYYEIAKKRIGEVQESTIKQEELFD